MFKILRELINKKTMKNEFQKDNKFWGNQPNIEICLFTKQCLHALYNNCSLKFNY